MRVSGKAYKSQLPFRERVMREHTAVQTDDLNRRWSYEIWIGEAPMTDECIIVRKWDSESEIVAPRDNQGEVLGQ